jgi:hypothetical protein
MHKYSKNKMPEVKKFEGGNIKSAINGALATVADDSRNIGERVC